MINIYKASAGSGKTFTLAREYIKLILGHKDEEGRYVLNRPGTRSGHGAVLAMTFTNKATEEMKSRIIHELAVLAGCERDWDEPSPYEKDLCADFACDRSRLAVAARDALLGLLYDFNRFSVSTIDSFFQTVLRSFAHEAEVSSNYALELDDEEVITMSIDRMLQSLNHGTPSRESHEIETWITGYMKSLIEEGNQFTLFRRGGSVQSGLIKFIANIHNDTFKENEKRIMDYLMDTGRFHRFCEMVFSRVREIRHEGVAACTGALSAVMALPDAGDLVLKTVIDLLRDCSAGGSKTYGKSELPKTVLKVIDNPEEMWKVAARRKSLTDPVVQSVVVEAIDKVAKGLETLSMLNVVRKNLYQLGLLSSVMELVDRFRRENATLLLSDTNALLSKIIGKEDSPFLYEKLGVRYHHYLIDEFQDTSVSQWENMWPLLRESLAYDYDNLVIGDEKQCIYRFRNSDPSLLHNLHNERWAEGRTVVRGDSVSENTNWRSSSDVVRFNNSLFTSMARQYGFEEIYSNVEQQVSPKHAAHRGYVLMSCFMPESVADPEEEALAMMARELRRQLESGYKPGDVAILVRKALEGERVIRYLEDLRLQDPTYPRFDIISDKSLLISHSDAVTNVISRLRMLSSSDVTIGSRRKSSREVARIINDYETVRTSGAAPDNALLTAIDRMRKRAEDSAAAGEPSEDTSLHGVDLISLVESIISTHVDASLRESDNVYITAFMDLLTKFVSQGRADMRSFLQWWDETGSTMSIAGGSDSRALNILTVHKSKGLEFHCVHIPFAESTTNKSDTAWFELPCIDGIPAEITPPMMPLTVNKTLASTPLATQYEGIKRDKVLDQTNLLYVAFTRAVDELIVGVKLTKSVMEPAKAGEMPSVGRMIYEAVEGACDTGLMPLAFDAGMRLVIGSPTVKRGEKTDKGTAMRPSTSERMPPYESTSSESVWENTNVDNDKLNRIQVARERGLILHELMSRIRRPSDVDRAFTMLKASPDARILTEADYAALREVVEARVNDPKAREWFDGYSKAYLEREIITADGRVLRVDRVVWTASGELHVIDYKTGSQDPRRYMKQVRDYMQFFRSIGYLQIQGYLYYLDSGEIVEVF